MTAGAIAPAAAARAADDRLDWAKLAAIGLMIANHALLALPEPWPRIGHLAGRPCLVLFTFILGSRLSERPASGAWRAAGRLALWGVVAQPIYLLLVGGVALRANVLVTLALGAVMVALWKPGRKIWLGALALAVLALSPWLDGGGLSAVAVAAPAVLNRIGRRAEAVALSAVCALVVLANLVAAPDMPLAAAVALLGAPLILLSRRLPSLPRAPGWLFYGVYPAHLFVIWLAFGPYE